MATDNLIKGNKAVFTLALTLNDVAVADLASDVLASSKFEIIPSDGGAAVISLAGNSAKVAIDTPVAGSIEVTLTSADMALAVGFYDVVYERAVDATDKIEYQERKAFQILPEEIT